MVTMAIPVCAKYQEPQVAFGLCTEISVLHCAYFTLSIEGESLHVMSINPCLETTLRPYTPDLPAVPNNTVTFIIASLDSEPCSPGGAYVHAPTGRHSCTWWVPDNQWVGSSWLLPTPSCNRALQITCPEIDCVVGQTVGGGLFWSLAFWS